MHGTGNHYAEINLRTRSGRQDSHHRPLVPRPVLISSRDGEFRNSGFVANWLE